MASVISLCQMEPFHLFWTNVSQAVLCFGWHIHLTSHSSFRALWGWFKWPSMHCNWNAETIYCTALSGKLGENTGLQMEIQWSILIYFLWTKAQFLICMWENQRTGRSEVSERDNSGEKSNHRSKCVHVQAGTNVAHVSRCYSQRVCKSDGEKIGLLMQMQDKVIEFNSRKKKRQFSMYYTLGDVAQVSAENYLCYC